MTELNPAIARALAPEFEILRPLGRGAMGTVHLARETALRRLVAIKVPNPGLARDPKVRSRFEREARAAARIGHRSAATIHGIRILEDLTPCIVMEYVEGRTVADILAAEGPFPLDAALDLLEQVAGALAAAHAEGVIHRDVRPGNVLWVPGQRRAVLTDFGIAGILETGTESVTRLTSPGENLGHPAFSSPEQLRGDIVTPAADLYSFAALAYHVLTGRGPHTATTKLGMAVAHLNQEAVPFAEVLPGADPRLAALLLHCLDKNPAHRPDAEHARTVLAAVRHGPLHAGARASLDEDPWSRFAAELRRRRIGKVVIAYAVAAYFVLEGVGFLVPTVIGERAYAVLVAVVLGGFPLALVLAWIYDIRGGRILRTESAPGAGRSAGLLLLQGVSLLASLLLAGALGWWILARS